MRKSSFQCMKDNQRMITLIFLLTLATVLYFFITKNFKFWSSHGFQSPPISVPFGHLKGIGTKEATCNLFNEFYQEFKNKTPAIGIYFFFSPVLMVLDLELIKNIFIREFSSFHDRGFYYNKVKYVPKYKI
jgi:cytochrome P450 family 6